jgi:hypothetical protein
MENKIFFAAGLGSTGSSALIDLLKEVDGFYSMHDEFRLFVDPGGLINLRDALVENWSVFQTDMAIRNFIKLVSSVNKKNILGPYSSLNFSSYFGDQLKLELDVFINNICELQFRGVWYGIDSTFTRRLNKYAKLRKSKFGSRKMYVGKQLSDDEFSVYVNDFIGKLVDSTLEKNNKNYFCFNENLSCMFPNKILNMLPDSKIILVVRDPKDVYVDSLRVNWAAIPEDPDEFIKWQILVYKGWMKVQEKFSNIPNSEKFLKVIKFEDLIENHAATAQEVFEFLGISEDLHINKGKYLKPENSIKNISQWQGKLSRDVVNKFDKELDFFYSYYNYSKGK